MWTLSSDSLAKSDPSSSFILLRWAELLDPATPDSYKPRLHDVPSLVAELHDVARLIPQDQRHRKYCELIIDELKSVLCSSVYAKALPASQLWSINRLARALQAEEWEVEAGRLRDTLPSALNIAIDLANKSSANLPKMKGKMSSNLALLASATLRTGYDHTDASVLQARNLIQMKPAQVLGKLTAEILKPARTFRCLVATYTDKANLSALASRMENCKAIESQACLECTTKARTFREAAQITIEKLISVSNVFNVYTNTHAVRFHAQVRVVDLTTKTERRIDLKAATLSSLRPRRQYLKLTENFLNAVGGRIHNDLVRTLEHYSLAHESTSPAMRLLNLWSALESLTASMPGKSALIRIQKSVAPIVGWRRTERNLRYLCIILMRYLKSSGTELDATLFPISHASKNFISPEEVFLSLVSPEDSRSQVALGNACSHNPLLTYRLWELHQAIKNPKSFACGLTNSVQRIKWQLARIYRVRNGIVHGGDMPSEIRFLVDHLHYYASMVAMRVMHDISNSPNWSPQTSLTHWGVKVDYLQHSLKAKPHALILEDLMPVMNDLGSQRIWRSKT